MSPEAGWLLIDQVVPRLRAVIPRSVPTIGSEDHEELVQDATCLAARIMHNGERKGKRIAHQSAAYYAIQHCKSGRRAVGHSAVDVHGSSTQLNGRSRLESMEAVVASDEETGGEIYLLHDVLGTDADDPAMAVARKLDWQEFLADLPAREKAVIGFLLEGASGSAIARKLRTTDSKIRAIKKRPARAIVEFMGPEILQEIQRMPAWKNSINATREGLACKHDRSHYIAPLCTCCLGLWSLSATGPDAGAGETTQVWELLCLDYRPSPQTLKRKEPNMKSIIAGNPHLAL